MTVANAHQDVERVAEGLARAVCCVSLLFIAKGAVNSLMASSRAEHEDELVGLVILSSASIVAGLYDRHCISAIVTAAFSAPMMYGLFSYGEMVWPRNDFPNR